MQAHLPRTLARQFLFDLPPQLLELNGLVRDLRIGVEAQGPEQHQGNEVYPRVLPRNVVNGHQVVTFIDHGFPPGLRSTIEAEAFPSTKACKSTNVPTNVKVVTSVVVCPPCSLSTSK